MDRLSLKAEERTVFGKKVKNLRKGGKLPAHVFGKGIETEHISVDEAIFLKIYSSARETGLINLAIGEEKIRPVLIREIQYHPLAGTPIHIDFYQVNLKEKVTVPIPIVLIGDDPESVHTGETVILQTLNEVSVEALPTDLIENIEVNIGALKNIDDTISVGQLSYDRDKLTVLAEPDEVVVKLAPAVTEEMKALLEEQEAEAQSAATEVEAAEGETEEPNEEEEGVTEVLVEKAEQTLPEGEDKKEG